MNTAARSLLLIAAACLAVVAACAEPDEDCVDSDCVVAPPNRCDGATLIVFSAPGTCVGDDCRFEATRQACDAGCEEITEPGAQGVRLVVGASCLEPEGSS